MFLQNCCGNWIHSIVFKTTKHIPSHVREFNFSFLSLSMLTSEYSVQSVERKKRKSTCVLTELTVKWGVTQYSTVIFAASIGCCGNTEEEEGSGADSRKQLLTGLIGEPARQWEREEQQQKHVPSRGNSMCRGMEGRENK